MVDMNVKQALSVFNLEEKEQEVFLVLSRFQWVTALELSKHTEISRTTLYRILEKLIKKGLIQVQIGDETTRYNTSAADSFTSLILEEKKKIELQEQAFKFLNIFMNNQQQSSNKTIVRFYEGVRGIKQLEWKKTQIPNSEILDFGSNSWWDIVGNDFAEEMRSRIVEQNITVKEIVNTEHFEPITSNETSWTKNTTFLHSHFYQRAIDKAKLHISSDILIINDAIHLQSYSENDVMGIEIINTNYVQMLTQWFMLLWNDAKILDNFGGEDFPL